MISQKNKQGWRNPWVLGLLVIILSGVLINGRMLWNVIHHPMRLLDENYTVKAHNQYDAKWMQQQAERSTLGWQASLHSPQQLQNDPLTASDAARFIVIANPVDFKFDLKDREGQPISDGKVDIEAQWPGDPSFDFKGSLHTVAAGRYEGSMNFPRAGNWDILIRAEHDGRHFDMEEKLFVSIPK
ncbi:MAG: FixH family protein [Gallionella sp.]|nr:FixH family protein [Gallionella sp.]MDP1939750.1 FixH family protein [Gallionella sp.]